MITCGVQIQLNNDPRWPETYYPDGPSIFDFQLYNLDEDIGEKQNLFNEMPGKVEEIRNRIKKVKNNLKTEDAI